MLQRPSNPPGDTTCSSHSAPRIWVPLVRPVAAMLATLTILTWLALVYPILFFRRLSRTPTAA